MLAAGAVGGVEVVAHCNFAWPTPSSVPVHRLGFVARQILSLCLQQIDRQREAREADPFTQVPALFEHEISGQSPSLTDF